MAFIAISVPNFLSLFAFITSAAIGSNAQLIPDNEGTLNSSSFSYPLFPCDLPFFFLSLFSSHLSFSCNYTDYSFKNHINTSNYYVYSFLITNIPIQIKQSNYCKFFPNCPSVSFWLTYYKEVKIWGSCIFLCTIDLYHFFFFNFLCLHWQILELKHDWLNRLLFAFFL